MHESLFLLIIIRSSHFSCLQISLGVEHENSPVYFDFLIKHTGKSGLGFSNFFFSFWIRIEYILPYF